MDTSTKSKRMTWFRFYSEALDDPKVQRLAPHLFKAWVNLLCLASTNDGKLPSIDDIAFRLRVSVQDAEQQVSDLIIAGLIDVTARGRTPHNWNGRQFVSDGSTERVRKHRKIKAVTQCNVSETANETAPEQIQSRADTETDSDGHAHEREPSDRPTEPDFIECKKAFNGSTDAMIAEVVSAMGAYGDKDGASQWLAVTLRTNGQDATAQAFQMLATARAEGKPIARVLPWWAKTAASLKASGGAKPKTEFVDRAAAKRAADRAYLESIGAM